jgi:hypothetical protein
MTRADPVASEPRRRPAAILLDEGGIRAVSHGERRYVALVTLADAHLVARPLAKPTLAMLTLSGECFATSIPAHVPVDGLIGALLERCDRAQRAKATLAYRHGDVGAWIATVVASRAAGGEAYRAPALDLDELERIFRDPTNENEARAAAAHALLVTGRRAVVAPRIGPWTPPLVLAAVRLAPGGESLATEELLRVALPFLTLRDRVVLAQRTRDP